MSRDTSLADKYKAHVQSRQVETEAALAAAGFDGLVIDAGFPLDYFADDTSAPYRPTPHFAHWCPLVAPGSLLVVRPGHKPHLIQVVPADFWHEHAQAGGEFWETSFDRTVVGTHDGAWKALAAMTSTAKRFASIGPDPARAKCQGLETQPATLVARLDWARATKTEYEISALRQATQDAAAGHRKALAAFEDGASELDIHLAFLSGVHTTESDLAYETIVGLDEKASVLHYHVKRHSANPGQTGNAGNVLLIDAGARSNGYCSDITRTYAKPAAHPLFRALVTSMETLQRDVCALVRPGVQYLDLHLDAHARLARVLLSHGILKNESPEAAVSLGHTSVFFPHGLGHLLGIQVHDVGGLQRAPEGGLHVRPKEHPFLRAMRTLEPGHVYTIEPGCYFIDMLLSPFRKASSSDTRVGGDAFNWPLIDALVPCGGIRIEDNVVVTERECLNLTRAALP